MTLFIVSVLGDTYDTYSVREMTRVVEQLPGDIEIVTGRNSDVMTVQMSPVAAKIAARQMPFALVEDYYELSLL